MKAASGSIKLNERVVVAGREVRARDESVMYEYSEGIGAVVIVTLAWLSVIELDAMESVAEAVGSESVGDSLKVGNETDSV